METQPPKSIRYMVRQNCRPNHIILPWEVFDVLTDLTFMLCATLKWATILAERANSDLVEGGQNAK